MKMSAHQRFAVHKEDRTQHTEEGPQVVPLPLLTHVQNHEGNKDAQGEGLLHDFQLRERQAIGSSQVVGGYHEAVLQKSESPAHQNQHPHGSLRGFARLAQESVPGKCHDDIAHKQQTDR